MALDGITTACIVQELNEELAGGRVNKIAQPEKDELLLTLKGISGQHRLLISANASLPLIYFTDQNKKSPATAPNFCMLLRKYIGSARILRVTQPELERVIFFEFEHLNDLGDVCRKRLAVELMGKHSNIIFLDEKDIILDSIKHVSANMSSVREVLPGRSYFIPHTQEKENPLIVTEDLFRETVCQKPLPAAKAIYSSLTGISPVMAQEICYRASIDGDLSILALREEEQLHLSHTFCRLMEDVKDGIFAPNIVYENDLPVEYGAMEYEQYREGTQSERMASMSETLRRYYEEKNAASRMRQRTSDLRHIVQTALDRNRKKLNLQEKQMGDTQKKDLYKMYGELIQTYGFGVENGSKEMLANRYDTGETIKIPLNPTLSITENAQRYFEKYRKMKRTQEALRTQLDETDAEITHLESIQNALAIAGSEADLVQIREELKQYGYIRKQESGKKQVLQEKAKPLHYLSSDGYHIYVGKNNFQNEELTFRMADGDDWWFHAKQMPGSHVIVKANHEDLPDRAFEEAAALAAYYSSGRMAPKVEVDYIQKKHVKKTPGGKPGFVIYHTNYSMAIAPDIDGLQMLP